jgi:WD40-like Beta Propeller Repeat
MPIARAKALKEWIWRPALACAAIAFALLLLSAPAHAAFPGKSAKIAFSSDRDGNFEIYSMNPDGSGVTRLTNDPGADCLAAWSADGRRIAFQSDRGTAGPTTCPRPSQTSNFDLYVMDANGTNPVKVTNDLAVKSVPTWSPDDSEIAFIESVSGIDTLYRIKPDGTGLAPVLSTGDVMRDPVWSSDGSEIAFTYSTMGFGLGHIATVKPDGTGFTDRTARNNAFFPDSSPDGSRYAYDREDFLAIVNHDGTGDHLVPNATAAEYYPSWAPDGSKLVVEHRGSPQQDIYTLNPDGTGRTNLTNSTSFDTQPDWQPIPITGYPRPKGATPFQTYLTVAYKLCASPNEQHGSPLAVLSCNPPQQTSDFLTVGTLDANGQAAKAVGSVRYDVKPGTAANPADDADVKMNISIKDVRLKDLSDYAGELQITSSRRITDKLSTPAPDGTTQAATTQDTPFSVIVPCAPTTSDTTVGSTCAISTTADAVVPGQVAENARSNWELGQIKVYDGGSDSDADTTADNTLFMDQGIFVP